MNIRKLFAPLCLSLALGGALTLAPAPAQAEVWQARYGVAETFNFKLYNADGTLDVDEADGGTEVSLSCNEGAETTATNDFVDEGTFYSIALTAAELQCERIAVVVAATTTEVFFIQTSANASAMTPTYEANVASVAAGAITAAAIATDAVDADAIAADAIGASELAANSITSSEVADDSIDAGAVAASAIGASELATGAITTAEFAAGAIDAAAIATDAIGAAELAADSIGASELATDAIGATEIAANAVAAAEIADAAIDEATYATDTRPRFGILTTGTAQAGSTGTTLVLAASENFTADNRINGATCAITSGTGAGESLGVSSYVNATDTATMNGTWPTTPDNTSVYLCWRTAPGAAGGGLDAAGVRAAIGLASANLDTQLTAIDDAVDTEVAAILVDTGTTLDDLVDDLESRLGTPSNLGGGATVAANLSDIEGQTDDIGAAGAGLTSLATQASVNTIDDFLDTEVAAIKAKTDSLTFTTAGEVDANIQSQNNAALCGAGTSGDKWRACP
jgi:hypothetical protein